MLKTKPEELLLRFRQHPYISTDSRIAQPGSIFFALKGESFNGNKYCKQAIENGATYAVIDDRDYFIDERTLLVDDVLLSLQQLASDYRNKLRIPIIGITGSNGKTTTKELMAAALSARFITHATVGNLNNHIGVPITILTIKPETEIAVIEMGANHIGEIAALCKIARPTHGVITNIGKAHLEGFGSAAGVVKAKSELYNHLRQNGGTVFVNADNSLLMSLTGDLERITYGKSKEAGFRGSLNSSGPLLEFDLEHPFISPVSTKLAGNYNFENAMAALCIANHFRVKPEDAIKAIEHYEPKMNRSQVMQTGRNTLILDAYNANPSSMQAAILNFASMQGRYKVLLLGDMFELGEETQNEHKAILNLALTQKFGKFITAGPLFAEAASGQQGVEAFKTTAELNDYLSTEMIEGATILIKGSRGMKLETITGNL
jgi:UDP-N-acetylmuramoyl-tripeptide--D-alanyl-D-alanine ligase